MAEDQEMKTFSATKARDKAVSAALRQGHAPMMLTKSGAMELWVCQNKGCYQRFDAWDTPTQINGPMPHSACKFSDQKIISRAASALLEVVVRAVRRNLFLFFGKK